MAAPNKGKMPVIFIGHGSPENAIEDNAYVRNWKKLASKIPKPKAILCISAHWLTDGTAVTAMATPKTIHDFYGFQDELYKIRYGAKGDPELAVRIKDLVRTVKVVEDKNWGLDHGCWVPLVRMYPQADIPVLQLSINMDLEPKQHYKIGKELSRLREEGVLIIGSGNIVHNLGMASMGIGTYPWALEFDAFVADKLNKGDMDALIGFEKQKSASLAHPTIDHYLPLLYVIGAVGKEKPEFFNDVFFAGSLSMRCVVY
jgi:4,5-DOPA dioxygenase extradiol